MVSDPINRKFIFYSIQPISPFNLIANLAGEGISPNQQTMFNIVNIKKQDNAQSCPQSARSSTHFMAAPSKYGDNIKLTSGSPLRVLRGSL
ncbi:hypothetical protein XELAEV_18038402mg [Xenopus laevis]|uniref:Uncharacterized protein n=1 Tax=Xenopus laevis TaxID=8355 RepID=A0A974C5Z2_XENLA|nr:hypothetical protein XELAEV_18038402mg [Xenopus laevis]